MTAFYFKFLPASLHLAAGPYYYVVSAPGHPETLTPTYRGKFVFK